MSVSSHDSFGQIWNVVSAWPEQLRAELADRILASIKRDSSTTFGRPWRDLRDLVGLAASATPPPSDEEVQRILEDELTRKHLRD